MSEPEIINHREYPSFGECIFCGAKGDGVELTDEHILPFSLGANATISKASCKDCATETGKIEGEIGRNALWDFRTHIKEQTRRPKDRPTEVEFKASINDGPFRSFNLPVGDAPLFTPMPVFGVPGIYAGIQPSPIFRVAKAHMYWWVPENIHELIGVAKTDKVYVSPPVIDFDMTKFARALAKFAYCQAVAKYGLHSFRRLVTPALILGRYPNVPYFVGATVNDPPPPGPKETKHSVVLHVTTIGRLRLLSASIRLYANSGTQDHGPPIYDVVIGVPPR